MPHFKYNIFEEMRESNKMGLETFTFDKHNVVDNPINKLIKDIKIEIEKNFKEHKEWIDLEENDPNKFNEINEIAQQTGHNLHIQMYEYLEHIGYLQDELFALCELKIIYAFKHLEINIKKLFSLAYNDISITKQSKWENLKQFLGSKNIDISKINGYAEVNQLREINNFLKHSDSDDSDKMVNQIIGIKSDEKMNHESLEKFYLKIKKYPNIFLASLANKIYEDLYEFDEQRIYEIAKSYAFRMDEDAAKKMSEKLLYYYKK